MHFKYACKYSLKTAVRQFDMPGLECKFVYPNVCCCTRIYNVSVK